MENISEEIWEQDLLEAGPLGPPALAPEGLVGKEGPVSKTKLPHSFHCRLNHWHTVDHVNELLTGNAPLCLLERIVLEWAAM